MFRGLKPRLIPIHDQHALGPWSIISQLLGGVAPVHEQICHDVP